MDAESSIVFSRIDDSLLTLNRVVKNFEHYTKTEGEKYDQQLQDFKKHLAKLSEVKNQKELGVEVKANTVVECEKKLFEIRDTEESREVENMKLQAKVETKKADLLETKLNNMKQLLRQKMMDEELEKLEKNENDKKDDLELTACIEFTRLEMLSSGDHRMKFLFKSISKLDREKLFYFVLDLSDSDVYSVTECHPNLPQIQEHIDQLNMDRDLYAFVKRVRKSFVKLAAEFSEPA